MPEPRADKLQGGGDAIDYLNGLKEQKDDEPVLVKNPVTRQPVQFKSIVTPGTSHVICDKCFGVENVVKPENEGNATSGSDCAKCGSWTNGVICHTCHIGMP